MCSKSRSIIALRGPGQFIGEVLLFDNTGRDSPMGSWQTCVRARTEVRALILTVKDLKDLVTRKPAAEVELRAGLYVYASSAMACHLAMLTHSAVPRMVAAVLLVPLHGVDGWFHNMMFPAPHGSRFQWHAFC